MREIITVNVGEAGINFGDVVWKKYCEDHNINLDGTISTQDTNQDDNTLFHQFFKESSKNRFTARTIMIDTDPCTVEAIRSSKMSKCVYDPIEYCIKGKEDCGNNFARGHYTVGKEIIDKFIDRCRMLVDNCDNFQGFIVNHSVKLCAASNLKIRFSMNIVFVIIIIKEHMI